MNGRNQLVRDGYNQAAERYSVYRESFESIPYLENLTRLLKPGAHVLDLGCGSGVPVDRYLLGRGFRVTGLDISEKQVELARVKNPDGSFHVADMSELKPNQFVVDAIVSFYAVFHIPRETHAELFRTCASYLPAGGLTLVTMGAEEWTGTDEFHGVTMYWSHFGAQTNAAMLTGAGFEILFDAIDRGGDERHQVLLARKKGLDRPD